MCKTALQKKARMAVTVFTIGPWKAAQSAEATSFAHMARKRAPGGNLLQGATILPEIPNAKAAHAGAHPLPEHSLSQLPAGYECVDGCDRVTHI